PPRYCCSNKSRRNATTSSATSLPHHKLVTVKNLPRIAVHLHPPDDRPNSRPRFDLLLRGVDDLREDARAVLKLYNRQVEGDLRFEPRQRLVELSVGHDIAGAWHIIVGKMALTTMPAPVDGRDDVWSAINAAVPIDAVLPVYT